MKPDDRACIFRSRVSGTHLSAELTGEQLADMKAYLNLTEMVLSNAELYITWAGKNGTQQGN